MSIIHRSCPGKLLFRVPEVSVGVLHRDTSGSTGFFLWRYSSGVGKGRGDHSRYLHRSIIDDSTSHEISGVTKKRHINKEDRWKNKKVQNCKFLPNNRVTINISWKFFVHDIVTLFLWRYYYEEKIQYIRVIERIQLLVTQGGYW